MSVIARVDYFRKKTARGIFSCCIFCKKNRVLQTQLTLTVTRVFHGYHWMLYIALERLPVVNSMVYELHSNLSMDVYDFLK
jgi:hypothetical protein